MGHAPHERITQEAFSVSQELIGLPLAGPWRRLAAIAIDLCLVALLVNVGGAVLLGISLVWVFLRLSARPSASAGGRLVRLGLRGGAALVLFSLGLKMWHGAESSVKKVATSALVDAARAPAKGRPGVLSGLGVGAGFIALQKADDEDDARRVARDLVKDMRSTGMKDTDIRSALDDFAAADADRPWLQGLLRGMADSAGVARTAAPRAVDRDSLALAYAGALRSRDTARARVIAPALGAVLASDSLQRLNGRVARLKEERTAMDRSLDEMRKKSESLEEMGLLHLIARVADELGIGFGWTGLYFTAFLALWKGQTPGKRLTGTRVVRLDGEKIGLWAAFERFGGYAASIFTGLLGFAQIFWDKNRQALHDKISETVVVRV